MLDIVFCSIPYSNLDHVYSAPAVLKGIVQSQGFKAKTKDFGIELLELCDRNYEKFVETQTYFISPGDPASAEQAKTLEKFYNIVCDFVESNPARIYSFSILSVYTHKSAFEILKRLKQQFPKQSILVGGRGAKVTAYQTIAYDLQIKGRERFLSYGELLKHRGIVDHVILGDGEDAVVELLSGKQISEQSHQSETLEYPLPDYSDYDFSKYLNWQNISMPITGSKGCVRECDFCDIKFQFGRFRYRSGTNIANEMIYVSETHGFKKFQFTDSLINGGLKPLEEFCTKLADYNKTHPDNQITWNAQYICRPKEQMPERLYALMSASGAHGLTIGAESGSDAVLEAMDKKTTMDALLHELEMFRKHNITCVLLTMVGHWAETHAEFIEHCKMFFKILPYVRSGTISAVSAGMPMVMLHGTPSQINASKNGVVASDFDQEVIWYVPANSTNTYRERVIRRLAVTKICDELNIPTISDLEFLLPIKNYLDKHYNKINQFYANFV